MFYGKNPERKFHENAIFSAYKIFPRKIFGGRFRGKVIFMAFLFLQCRLSQKKKLSYSHETPESSIIFINIIL
jgi:hypothetical protein